MSHRLNPNHNAFSPDKSPIQSIQNIASHDSPFNNYGNCKNFGPNSGVQGPISPWNVSPEMNEVDGKMVNIYDAPAQRHGGNFRYVMNSSKPRYNNATLANGGNNISSYPVNNLTNINGTGVRNMNGEVFQHSPSSSSPLSPLLSSDSPSFYHPQANGYYRPTIGSKIAADPHSSIASSDDYSSQNEKACQYERSTSSALINTNVTKTDDSCNVNRKISDNFSTTYPQKEMSQIRSEKKSRARKYLDNCVDVLSPNYDAKGDISQDSINVEKNDSMKAKEGLESSTEKNSPSHPLPVTFLPYHQYGQNSTVVNSKGRYMNCNPQYLQPQHNNIRHESYMVPMYQSPVSACSSPDMEAFIYNSSSPSPYTNTSHGLHYSPVYNATQSQLNSSTMSNKLGIKSYPPSSKFTVSQSPSPPNYYNMAVPNSNSSSSFHDAKYTPPLSQSNSNNSSFISTTSNKIKFKNNEEDTFIYNDEEGSSRYNGSKQVHDDRSEVSFSPTIQSQPKCLSNNNSSPLPFNSLSPASFQSLPSQNMVLDNARILSPKAKQSLSSQEDSCSKSEEKSFYYSDNEIKDGRHCPRNHGDSTKDLRTFGGKTTENIDYVKSESAENENMHKKSGIFVEQTSIAPRKIVDYSKINQERRPSTLRRNRIESNTSTTSILSDGNVDSVLNRRTRTHSDLCRFIDRNQSKYIDRYMKDNNSNPPSPEKNKNEGDVTQNTEVAFPLNEIPKTRPSSIHIRRSAVMEIEPPISNRSQDRKNDRISSDEIRSDNGKINNTRKKHNENMKGDIDKSNSKKNGSQNKTCGVPIMMSMSIPGNGTDDNSFNRSPPSDSSSYLVGRQMQNLSINNDIITKKSSGVDSFTNEKIVIQGKNSYPGHQMTSVNFLEKELYPSEKGSLSKDTGEDIFDRKTEEYEHQLNSSSFSIPHPDMALQGTSIGTSIPTGKIAMVMGLSALQSTHLPKATNPVRNVYIDPSKKSRDACAEDSGTRSNQNKFSKQENNFERSDSPSLSISSRADLSDSTPVRQPILSVEKTKTSYSTGNGIEGLDRSKLSILKSKEKEFVEGGRTKVTSNGAHRRRSSASGSRSFLKTVSLNRSKSSSMVAPSSTKGSGTPLQSTNEAFPESSGMTACSENKLHEPPREKSYRSHRASSAREESKTNSQFNRNDAKPHTKDDIEHNSNKLRKNTAFEIQSGNTQPASVDKPGRLRRHSSMPNPSINNSFFSDDDNLNTVQDHYDQGLRRNDYTQDVSSSSPSRSPQLKRTNESFSQSKEQVEVKSKRITNTNRSEYIKKNREHSRSSLGTTSSPNTSPLKSSSNSPATTKASTSLLSQNRESLDYLAEQDILPLSDAQQCANKVYNSISTAEWPDIFHLLNLVRRLAFHHPQLLCSSPISPFSEGKRASLCSLQANTTKDPVKEKEVKLSILVREIVKQVDNLRSQVAKNALLALGDLWHGLAVYEKVDEEANLLPSVNAPISKVLYNKMDWYGELASVLAPVLVRRFSDTSGFLGSVAERCINKIIQYSAHSTNAFCLHKLFAAFLCGNLTQHRTGAVRGKTAMVVHHIIAYHVHINNQTRDNYDSVNTLMQTKPSCFSQTYPPPSFSTKSQGNAFIFSNKDIDRLMVVLSNFITDANADCRMCAKQTVLLLIKHNLFRVDHDSNSVLINGSSQFESKNKTTKRSMNDVHIGTSKHNSIPMDVLNKIKDINIPLFFLRSETSTEISLSPLLKQQKYTNSNNYTSSKGPLSTKISKNMSQNRQGMENVSPATNDSDEESIYSLNSMNSSSLETSNESSTRNNNEYIFGKGGILSQSVSKSRKDAQQGNTSNGSRSRRASNLGNGSSITSSDGNLYAGNGVSNLRKEMNFDSLVEEYNSPNQQSLGNQEGQEQFSQDELFFLQQHEEKNRLSKTKFRRER